MPWEIFEQSLDFLIRSGIQEACLLGGEPTLHHDFIQMVDRVLERGLRLLVFTGGLVNQKVLSRLEKVEEGKLLVLVNVVSPNDNLPSLIKRQSILYHRLGSRVMLGMNIASSSIEFNFLLDLIEEFGLSPHIRLGLAHPELSGGNCFLHSKDYPKIGRKVMSFGLNARNRGIRLELDCGWVPCMFPDGGLSMLEINSDDVGTRCNPILDILPNGQVISCYPLASHSQEYLSEKQDADGLRLRFSQLLTAHRHFHLYKKCAHCEWREQGACVGGCLAASLLRLRDANLSFSVPKI